MISLASKMNLLFLAQHSVRFLMYHLHMTLCFSLRMFPYSTCTNPTFLNYSVSSVHLSYLAFNPCSPTWMAPNFPLSLPWVTSTPPSSSFSPISPVRCAEGTCGNELRGPRRFLQVLQVVVVVVKEHSILPLLCSPFFIFYLGQ